MATEAKTEEFVSPGDRFAPTRPSKFSYMAGAALFVAFTVFVMSQDVNAVGKEAAPRTQVAQQAEQ
ncbi:MAG: hypothetical protein R3229_01810 [Alphaproteobacteria bacterium]|nr:hypothetical protein [Alphaproteobacteria bacterium]